MTRQGRPLRFLVALLGGWIGLRAVMLWPTPAPETLLAETNTPHAPTVVAQGASFAMKPPGALHPDNSAPAPDARQEATRTAGRLAIRAGPAPTVPRAMPTGVSGEPLLALLPPAAPHPVQPPPPPPFPPASPHLPPRLSASLWSIVRGGGSVPFAQQLGGSQAGARLVYAIDDAHRVAIAGRVAVALGSRQREAGIGIDWRPTRLPIHLIVEQRIGITAARGGTALGLIGGIAPRPLAAGLDIDVYGQGGAIARDGIEGYVDGAVRVSRNVASVGAARIELGIAAWGGAQRGAARLDAGPAAAILVPIAARNLRMSLEWRQRVAGSAAPASGPALTMGTDF